MFGLIALVTSFKKSLLEDSDSGRALLLPGAEILQKGVEQQVQKALEILNLK